MQLLNAAIVLLLPLLLVTSCRAADQEQTPSTAASAPAGLTTSATVTHGATGWVAEIKLTNNTNLPLATGRFTGFTLTRTDTASPQVVIASPPEMAPHFRVQLPPGEARQTSITLWDRPDSLPAGTYHVTVTFPPDVLPTPVEADFTVPASTTQKHS